MIITFVHKDKTETAIPAPPVATGYNAFVDPAYQKFHAIHSIKFDLAASTPTCFCRLKSGEERSFSLSDKEMAFISLVEMGQRHPLDLFMQVIYPHVPDKHIENTLQKDAQKRLCTVEKDYWKDRKRITTKIKSLKNRLVVVERRIEKGAVLKPSFTKKVGTLEKLDHHLLAEHSTTLPEFLTERVELNGKLASLNKKIASTQASIDERKCTIRELTSSTGSSSSLTGGVISHEIEKNCSVYRLRLEQLQNVKLSIQQLESQLKKSAHEPEDSRNRMILGTQLLDLQHQHFLLTNASNLYESLIPPAAKELIKLERDLKKLTDQQAHVVAKISKHDQISTSFSLSSSSRKKFEKHKRLFDEKPQLKREIFLAKKELADLRFRRRELYLT
ncbi:MAG: hypothetical protein V4492_00410 [Chlamydiota bacterium]